MLKPSAKNFAVPAVAKNSLSQKRHHETPFLRTKFQLRELPVSVCGLGVSRNGRNAGGYFQRRLPAVVAQSGPFLSVPPGAREPREVQAVVREPPDFAQGRGH